MSGYIQIYDGEFSSSHRLKGDIIALAGIIVKEDTLEKVDSFLEYACPRDFSSWNSFAQEAHGFTKEATKKFPPQRDLAIKLLHFLKPYKNDNNEPIPMIIHASSFVDYDFIEALYKKVGIEGSIQKVIRRTHVVRTDLVYREYLRSIFKDPKLKPKTNLQCMSDQFNFALDHHECMSDTQACHVGLVEMVKYFKGKKPLSGTVDFEPFNNVVRNFKG